MTDEVTGPCHAAAATLYTKPDFKVVSIDLGPTTRDVHPATSIIPDLPSNSRVSINPRREI